MALDWPTEFERTPARKRIPGSKFRVNWGQTKQEIRGEMKRLEADEWRLDHETGSGGDPGVVVRWRKNDDEYAVGCDKYKGKAANARAVYLWIRETRKRGDRPVRTGAEEFAAARLPPGEEDAIVADDGSMEAPHEVLGVAPDAPTNVVKAAARRLSADVHPDQGEGGDVEQYHRIQRAKRSMLEGES